MKPFRNRLQFMHEVIVTRSLASVIYGKHTGKKDMPLVFRLVGRTVGKVSGLVQGGRARMAQMSKGNDLLQVRVKLWRERDTW